MESNGLKEIILITTGLELSKPNKTIPWLEEGMKSRWFNNREEAKGRIQRQETARLENETFTRPNRKYAFVSYMSIQCNVILDNQPLHVGKDQERFVCIGNFQRQSVCFSLFGGAKRSA